MKIVITLSYYLPNISGLTIYVRNLSEELVKRGYGVEIITSRYIKELPSGEKLNKVNIKRVWTPLIFGRGAIMPTYLFDVYKSIKSADIVNIHLPQFEGIFTSVISKLLGKKLIITYHCDLSFWGGILNTLSTAAVYKSNFVSCILADKIIVNSEDYAKTSWFLNIFKNKLVYIYPPVKIGKAKLGTLKKYRDIKYKIGYVGRISKEKGVGYLLKSVKYLKEYLTDFKIFLAGPKDDVIGGSQENEIKNLIKKYKDNIVFLGKLTDEELWGFYKEIDVLVLPSVERQESFGMVQVEAMMSGCPVVASNLPGVRVPIHISGMGLLTPKREPIKIAQSINILLKKKNNKTVNNRTLTCLSLRNSVKKYEETFDSLSLQ